MGKVGFSKTEGSKSAGLLRALRGSRRRKREDSMPRAFARPRHPGEALAGVGVAEFRAGTSHWVQSFAAQEAPPWVTMRALKRGDKATVQGHTAAWGRVHPPGFRSSFLFPATCPAPAPCTLARRSARSLSSCGQPWAEQASATGSGVCPAQAASVVSKASPRSRLPALLWPRLSRGSEQDLLGHRPRAHPRAALLCCRAQRPTA